MDSEKFIASLGIPNIGKNVSKQLIDYYGTLSNMFDNVDKDIVVLEGFDGFGNVIIKSIYDNIDSIRLCYNSFEYYGVDFVSNNNISIANDNSSKLNGAKFILSGSFSVKKSIIEYNIIENGGQLASSVNKDLDYLVTNETGTSKYLKAVQLGKKIITEQQIMDMLK
jgi:DNA ligase (NAD+)